MLHLGVGLAFLIGYIVFERNFPKRPKIDIEHNQFELNVPIVNGDIYIRPPVRGLEYDDIVEYDVKCRIRPIKAKLNNGLYYDMHVPDAFIIRDFSIGVNVSDNTVKYVELGPDSYHADKCEKTNCFYLGELKDDVISKQFIIDLVSRFQVYELENTMAFDHWDNAEFQKKNSRLIDQMKPT